MSAHDGQDPSKSSGSDSKDAPHVKVATRSLRAKFLWVVVPFCLLSTAIVFGLSELSARSEAERRLTEKLEEIAQIQSAVLSESVWNVAHEQVALLLSALATDPDVAAAAVYDETGEQIATVGNVEGLTQNEFFARTDILHGTGDAAEIIGRLELALTDERVRSESATRLVIAAGLALLLLLSVTVIALVAYRRTIGIPIDLLLASINASRTTGERAQVTWHSSDEIGTVISAFNEMQRQQAAYEGELTRARDDLEERVRQRTAELAEKTSTLEQLSQKLSKYLSPQIYESIFSGQQEVKVTSQRKKLTVFFSDIAGFTETSDKLESEELTQLLNQYLTEMTGIALDFGATVDKYMGDGMMVFFGDPDTRGVAEDARLCVKMAIAMRERLRELADEWRASGVRSPMEVRIGIHTGYCTVGNFGSEDRMDYTIIGGSVNTASRLESAAAPGEILISYETFALVEDEIYCEEQGTIDVKGIAYPVATYRVIDTYDSLQQRFQHFHEQHPHFALDLDIASMTAAEKSEAMRMLQEGMGLLEGTSRATGNSPETNKNRK